MQTEKRPYELLIRWDKDGTLAGAHVQWRYVIKEDDGTVIGESVTGSEAIEAAGRKGFPLHDILSQVQADALVECGKAQARVAELESQKSALESRMAAFE